MHEAKTACFVPNGKHSALPLDQAFIRCLDKLPIWESVIKPTSPSTITRGADKSLARRTSRYILFDGENISFDASLIIYRVSQEERT